jgi:hypothetical protein
MNPDGTYRVLRLVAENVKKLKAVDITPDRHTVMVTGRNAQGKSSVLQCIEYALGGKKALPSVPIRRGEDDGQILCILGDNETGEKLLVKRTFRADGKTNLEITAEGGFAAPSPQTILDALVSKVSFDPTSFVRMDDDKQLETLRQLVGLDFTADDRQYKTIYDNRTQVNRTAKEKAAQAAGIVVPPDTPAEEVSIEGLMAQQRERQEKNKLNQRERDKVQSLQRDVTIHDEQITRVESDISELERQLESKRRSLAASKERLAQAIALCNAQKATVAVLEDADTRDIEQQIVNAQTVNRNVGKAQQKAALLKEAEAQQAASKELTGKLEAIEAEKTTKLASVAWPVAGLGFGDTGVTYNGLPFSQASGAEQLRVSVAIGAALSPRLKVILCRDASLLDEEQLGVITEFAEKEGIQVWLEIVDSEGGPGKIVIEEGMVTSGGTPAEAPPAETKPKRGKKAGKEAEAPAVIAQPVAAPTTPPQPQAAPWETPKALDGQEEFDF